MFLQRKNNEAPEDGSEEDERVRFISCVKSVGEGSEEEAGAGTGPKGDGPGSEW